MEVNGGMRTVASDCTLIASQILGGHSLGSSSLVEADGGGAAAAVESGHSVNSGRRTSRVWKYFRMVDNCHYVCCLCNFVGAYTNTTNMRKHIQNHHPEIFQDILDHTRPSNRLHYLRSFQQTTSSSSLFPSLSSTGPSASSTLSYDLGSVANTNSHPLHHQHHQQQQQQHFLSSTEPPAAVGVGETGDPSSYLAASHSGLLPQRDQYWDQPVDHPRNDSYHKGSSSRSLWKSEAKADILDQCFGEDRKHEGGGSHSGNLTSYPPGISENSRSSGENQGACDDVSVPVSPEQFLSEEMDQGGSPHTPSQRPESYKLRHNNHLMLVLESLAGDESFMDVTLTAQGKAIKAHKSVLSAVSPYFRSVLKENPCQHPIIIMPRDIRFEELNNIISYIYKGEMTVAAEDLSSLLKTAEILQVTGLSPSDSGAGAGGIMSQMQGLPSALFSNSTSKKSSKQKPPPPPPPSLQQSGDDASSDQQGRIDPLEFLNTDLSCVKEEVQSDNEDGGDESRFQPPLDMGRSNNSSEGSTNAPSEYPNASPVRNRSVDESSNKSEELSNKHFNPGESPPEGGETPSDASPSSSTPHLCPFCSETHRPLDALQTHLRLKHPSKAAFVCSCGRVFHRISLLTEHSKKCKV